MIPSAWPAADAKEWPVIEAISHLVNVDACFIGAIRRAENGASGREFGILAVRAPTFDDQCRACCHTIARYLSEYGRNPLQFVTSPTLTDPVTHVYASRRVLYATPFIEYVSGRYAPSGAGNDPHNLNANWIANVSQWYRRLANA